MSLAFHHTGRVEKMAIFKVEYKGDGNIYVEHHTGEAWESINADKSLKGVRAVLKVMNDRIIQDVKAMNNLEKDGE